MVKHHYHSSYNFTEYTEIIFPFFFLGCFKEETKDDLHLNLGTTRSIYNAAAPSSYCPSPAAPISLSASVPDQ